MYPGVKSVVWRSDAIPQVGLAECYVASAQIGPLGNHLSGPYSLPKPEDNFPWPRVISESRKTLFSRAKSEWDFNGFPSSMTVRQVLLAQEGNSLSQRKIHRPCYQYNSVQLFPINIMTKTIIESTKIREKEWFFSSRPCYLGFRNAWVLLVSTLRNNLSLRQFSLSISALRNSIELSKSDWLFHLGPNVTIIMLTIVVNPA
jgi:hypothetical protein